MFKKKKDKIENNSINQKLFLKDNIVYKRLISRTNSFYIYKNKKYTTLCLIYSFIILILTTISHHNILDKNSNQKTYLTTIMGNTLEYKNTEKRNEVVDNFIKNYNNKGKN